MFQNMRLPLFLFFFCYHFGPRFGPWSSDTSFLMTWGAQCLLCLACCSSWEPNLYTVSCNIASNELHLSVFGDGEDKFTGKVTVKNPDLWEFISQIKSQVGTWIFLFFKWATIPAILLYIHNKEWPKGYFSFIYNTLYLFLIFIGCAWGMQSSQARDWTWATAVTQTIAVTMLGP